MTTYNYDNRQDPNPNYYFSGEFIAGKVSPDLWPEQIPGVTDFTAKFINTPGSGRTSPTMNTKVNLDLERDDINLMNDLGQLNPDRLMGHIKALQNLAYQLGLEEVKQLTRGKILKVLETPDRP